MDLVIGNWNQSSPIRQAQLGIRLAGAARISFLQWSILSQLASGFRWQIIVILATSCIAADPPGTNPPPKPLPADVVAAITELTDGEVKLRKDFESKLAVIRDKAAKAVEAAQVRATKAGDLDAAIALKAKAAEIRDGKLAAEGLPGTDNEKASAIRRFLVRGSWKLLWTSPQGKSGTDAISFNEDGTIGKGANGYQNKWRLEGADLVLVTSGGQPLCQMKYNEGEKRWVQLETSISPNGNRHIVAAE